MEEPRTLHWLPCSIKYTGVAKVGAYFLPAPTGDPCESQLSCIPMDSRFFWGEDLLYFESTYVDIPYSTGTTVDGRAVQEAYFRGRQLKGGNKTSRTFLSLIVGMSNPFPSATGAPERWVSVGSTIVHCFMDAGTQLQIPKGYRGEILRRTAEQHTDGDSTPQWSPEMAFREFVYWKHGLDPICTDSAQRRMAFLKISEQV